MVMKIKKYRFVNHDESFTQTFQTLAQALKECSDYKTFKAKDSNTWYTREGGFVYKEANN